VTTRPSGCCSRAVPAHNNDLARVTIGHLALIAKACGCILQMDMGQMDMGRCARGRTCDDVRCLAYARDQTTPNHSASLDHTP
jgi:hypothetical protein